MSIEILSSDGMILNKNSVDNNYVDIVMSNYLINLTTNKENTFRATIFEAEWLDIAIKRGYIGCKSV
jgi:hypothetical protein